MQACHLVGKFNAPAKSMAETAASTEFMTIEGRLFWYKWQTSRELFLVRDWLGWEITRSIWTIAWIALFFLGPFTKINNYRYLIFWAWPPTGWSDTVQCFHGVMFVCLYFRFPFSRLDIRTASTFIGVAFIKWQQTMTTLSFCACSMNEGSQLLQKVKSSESWQAGRESECSNMHSTATNTSRLVLKHVQVCTWIYQLATKLLWYY